MNLRKFFLISMVFIIAGGLVFSVFAWGKAAGPQQPAAQDTPAPTPTPALAAEGLSARLAPSIQPGAVSPLGPVVIQFSQPMSAALLTTLPTTVSGTVSTTISTTLPAAVSATLPAESAGPALLTLPYVPGDLTWNETYTELTFSPRQPFEPDRDYLVFLDGDLRSASGEGFSQPQQWEIHTRTPPRVINRTPAQVGIAPGKFSIRLSFDQAMDAESVAAAFTIQPTLPYSLSWKSEKELTIDLQAPTVYSTRYRFTLGGSAGDASGVPMKYDYAWEYWTEDFSLQLAPENGSVSDELNLKFSHDLDSVRSGMPFIIDPPVNGAWGWNGKRQAIFKAGEPFAPGMWYSLYISSTLVDAYGTAITVTQPISFYARPPIKQVDPRPDQAVDCQVIRLHFERPVDRDSVEKSFQVSPTLEGVFTWFTNTMIFTPTAWIDAYDQLYQATLQTGALDEAGQPFLVEPYRWAFTCKENPTGNEWGYSEPLFGQHGAHIQALDAEGRRALHFGSSYGLSEGTITFRLYRLEVEEFVARYISNDWFANLPETPFKTWQDPLEDNNAQEFFIPKSVPPGLYILKASITDSQDTNYKLEDFLLLDLTYNTLILKYGVGQISAWLSDINGSAANERAEMLVYDQQGELLARGRADEDGAWELRLSSGRQPALVIARTQGEEGEDLTIAGTSRTWKQGHTYYWSRSRYDLPPLQQFKIYAYTDRPIYRPGQAVYFKAIVRQDDDARYSLLPEGTPVTVTLRDGRDNLLQTLITQTNTYGSLNGEFSLAQGAGAGEYSLEFAIQGEQHRQPFKVQEYRKPDYRVTVKADNERYVDGETMQIGVDASYFYGQPVKAALTLRIYPVDNYYSWWWDGESQDSDEKERYVWSANPVATYTAEADASGQYTFTLPARIARYDQYRWYWWGDSLEKSSYALEVTADDGSNQTVSAYAIVHVFNAAERLSLETDDYYHEAGQPFTLTAQVQTLDNEPVSGRDIQIEVKRLDPDDWEYAPITQARLTSDLDGTDSISLTLNYTGYYSLRLSSKDSYGHTIEYGRGVYLFNPQGKNWTSLGGGYSRGSWEEFDDENYLSISTDRQEYKPYETAHLEIESTFSGPALLTFERSQVYRSMPVKLTAPLTIIDVPILESDAPNVFITINAWQSRSSSLAEHREKYPEEYFLYNLPDSRLRLGQVEIQVDASSKELEVGISSAQTIYAPGQPATFTVQVQDAQGEPAQAELSLALVDESIYSLSSELSPPIFEAFYGRRELGVDSFDSMAPFREIIIEGRGGGGGGEYYPIADLRSNFQDTAVWLPALQTDENGFVTVTVRLPDDLTSWRLTAKAITQNTRVGEGRLNIQTQREVVVDPVLPQSLVTSDEVRLAALVHNYGAARPFTITLAGDLLEVFTPTQVISLSAGEGRRVEWLAVARQAGTAQVIVQATPISGTGDAVQLPLRIDPLAVPYVYEQAGSFQGQLTATLALPDSALDSSSVNLRLTRSIAGSLLDGLEYLTGYPYGCVEQTMSRALPNAVVGRALAKLGGEGASLKYDLPALVADGLARLYGMQHLDGGWGWWHDDVTHDYQTAWVVFGLAVTADAGYKVEPRVIENGASWLAAHLDEMDARTRAYALYSLAVAGHPQGEAALALAASPQRLDAFSQAALALALHEMGETQAAQSLLDLLAVNAAHQGGQVYWPTFREDGEYDDKTMASTRRSTALALDAFVRIRPDDPLIPDIVRYLMSQRQPQGWGSTNETAFAILALTDYLYATTVSAEPAGYRIELNGQTLLTGAFSAEAYALDMTIPITHMAAGLNQLSITQQSESPLYYVLNSHVDIPKPAVQKAGKLSVTRRYLDPKSGLELRTATARQLVRVELTIEAPQPGSYILLEDHLPGGLEALNTNLNITSHEALIDEEGDPYERFFWEDYGYNNKEIRGSQVIFFITNLKNGRTVITYLARATQPGAFIALPAELSAMYDLATWARSDSAVVTVSSTLSETESVNAPAAAPKDDKVGQP